MKSRSTSIIKEGVLFSLSSNPCSSSIAIFFSKFEVFDDFFIFFFAILQLFVDGIENQSVLMIEKTLGLSWISIFL